MIRCDGSGTAVCNLKSSLTKTMETNGRNPIAMPCQTKCSNHLKHSQARNNSNKRSSDAFTIGAAAGTTTYDFELTVVPKPTTAIAGALLLLPFAACTIRKLGKNRTA